MGRSVVVRALRGVRDVGGAMLRGAAWGFVIGVPIGIIGRTVMRAVALLGGLEPTWSAIFSLHLVFMIAFVNGALGFSYGAIRGAVPGGRRRGVVFGAIALVVAVYPALLAEASALVAEVGLTAVVFGVTALSALFLLDGVWLEAALGARERRTAAGVGASAEERPAADDRALHIAGASRAGSGVPNPRQGPRPATSAGPGVPTSP